MSEYRYTFNVSPAYNRSGQLSMKVAGAVKAAFDALGSTAWPKRITIADEDMLGEQWYITFGVADSAHHPLEIEQKIRDFIESSS